MTLVAPRIVNDVSYACRINHESDFAWQVHYLVKLEGDSCCSAHIVNDVSNVRTINHENDLSWKAQYLVKHHRVENIREEHIRVENNREDQSRVETSREE